MTRALAALAPRPRRVVLVLVLVRAILAGALFLDRAAQRLGDRFAVRVLGVGQCLLAGAQVAHEVVQPGPVQPGKGVLARAVQKRAVQKRGAQKRGVGGRRLRSRGFRGCVAGRAGGAVGGKGLGHGSTLLDVDRARRRNAKRPGIEPGARSWTQAKSTVRYCTTCPAGAVCATCDTGCR